MKTYRVSLEVVTSLAVTYSGLADLLGVPPSTLAKEQGRKSVLWRYEPRAGQTAALVDRVSRLASEVRPTEALGSGRGIRKVCLAIEVHYDTVTCTVVLPLHCVASLAKSIPELDTIALTCSPSDEALAPNHRGKPPGDPDLTEEEARKVYDEWTAAGRPRGPSARAPLVIDHSRRRPGRRESNRTRRADANRYIVSLDAITSTSTTASEMADLLGLPPASFYRQRTADGAVWTCEVEADQTVSLTECISFLTSEIHSRRPLRSGGKIKEVYLDIGVLYDIRRTATCSVSLPLPCLGSLARKMPKIGIVKVSCYPIAHLAHALPRAEHVRRRCQQR